MSLWDTTKMPKYRRQSSIWVKKSIVNQKVQHQNQPKAHLSPEQSAVLYTLRNVFTFFETNSVRQKGVGLIRYDISSKSGSSSVAVVQEYCIAPKTRSLRPTNASDTAGKFERKNCSRISGWGGVFWLQCVFGSRLYTNIYCSHW